MTSSTYVIRGGPEGRERLRVLGRVMWPTTGALLDTVGIDRSARCIDLGCGGGDVTLALAALAPEGSVLGVDMDTTKLDIAREEATGAGVSNVEFRVLDVMATDNTHRESYDLAYARFLLTHLHDPATAVANIVDLLAPGGALIVEDIDFRGHFCEPACSAFSRFVDLYTQVVQARGCDPNIGPRLPGLLADAGLRERGMNVVQPAGFEGEAKLMAPITMEAIADALLGAGLTTADEINAIVDELYEFAGTEGTIMSLPRIVQAWGRVAG